MKKDIAKKWAKALRSGKYKQGQGLLKQTTTLGNTYHCCLGVLCELYNQDMKDKKKKGAKESMGLYGTHRFSNQSEHLPISVKKWAGLCSSIGDFTQKNSHNLYSLAEMNDLGKKFKTIANTIEKEWENL